MMLRPILPKPLMPILMAMRVSPLSSSKAAMRTLNVIEELAAPDGRPGRGYHVTPCTSSTSALMSWRSCCRPGSSCQAIKEYVRRQRRAAGGYLPVSFNLDGDDSIWIHAVSVGEALTARALIADLRDRYPNLKLFLSTTTLTGQQIATRLQGVDAVFFNRSICRRSSIGRSGSCVRGSSS